MADRPAHVKPPAYLSASPPVPAPDVDAVPAVPHSSKGGPDGLDPTRYGDWEVKGVAIDF